MRDHLKPSRSTKNLVLILPDVFKIILNLLPLKLLKPSKYLLILPDSIRNARGLVK